MVSSKFYLHNMYLLGTSKAGPENEVSSIPCPHTQFIYSRLLLCLLERNVGRKKWNLNRTCDPDGGFYSIVPAPRLLSSHQPTSSIRQLFIVTRHQIPSNCAEKFV